MAGLGPLFPETYAFIEVPADNLHAISRHQVIAARSSKFRRNTFHRKEKQQRCCGCVRFLSLVTVVFISI